MEEQWREVPNTYYSVSDAGRVASRYHGRWTIFKPRDNGGGYLQVKLMLQGVPTDVYVHRLIAAMFLPPRPTPTHQINHVDGDKKNNGPANLEWTTPRQNTAHFHASHKQKKTAKAGRFTPDQVREIRGRLSKGETKSGLARFYGVSRGAIRAIFARRSFPNVV